MGLHGSDTASISLDDVHVGEDGMLGEIGDGFKVAMSSLDSGRYSVAFGCVGICQGCVDESVKYAKERVQFSRPIASFQLVQAMIAEMRVKTDAARLLTLRAGVLKDKQSRTPSRRRSPSCTPPSQPSSARTRPSRSSAAPATSTTTRSSATSAMSASRPSTRARRRSRSSSSAAR